VRPKMRRARAAAAGPGLWKLCEQQQSRRQVRGLIDFRHPLSSLPTPPRAPVTTRGSHCTEAERFTPNQSPSASIPKNTPRRRRPSPGGGGVRVSESVFGGCEGADNPRVLDAAAAAREESVVVVI